VLVDLRAAAQKAYCCFRSLFFMNNCPGKKEETVRIVFSTL
jgi:hypothetical protein